MSEGASPGDLVRAALSGCQFAWSALSVLLRPVAFSVGIRILGNEADGARCQSLEVRGGMAVSCDFGTFDVLGQPIRVRLLDPEGEPPVFWVMHAQAPGPPGECPGYRPGTSSCRESGMLWWADPRLADCSCHRRASYSSYVESTRPEPVGQFGDFSHDGEAYLFVDNPNVIHRVWACTGGATPDGS
jgi:hypothetical protein